MPSLDFVREQSRSIRLIPDGVRVVVTVRVMPMASVLFAVMTVTIDEFDWTAQIKANVTNFL